MSMENIRSTPWLKHAPTPTSADEAGSADSAASQKSAGEAGSAAAKLYKKFTGPDVQDRGMEVAGSVTSPGKEGYDTGA